MTAPAPGVLRIPAFRRLWISLSLSSLGDWLGLLATTSLAQELVRGYAGKLYALAGVLVVRLLPAMIVGPLAGAFADRFDRRRTMVVADIVRCALFVSIPFAESLLWLFAASFLVEVASLFWVPAKEASVPNLVPRERLESANQLSLVTTYGSAAVAALVFALLAKLDLLIDSLITGYTANQVDIALYFDALTYLVSALTIWSLRQIAAVPRREREGDKAPSLVGSVVAGWRFLGSTRWLRGLVVGILGSVVAGGAVIGLGRSFAVLDLGGGNAAYGVLFGTLFVGLASGMMTGTRIFPGFSRRRLMGLAIVAAGVALSLDAIMPNFALVVAFTFLVGLFAGVTWVMGMTLIGLEVGDELRGRTFSSLYTLMRVDLLLLLAAAPFIAGAIGSHGVRVSDDLRLRADGVTDVLFVSGLVAVAAGVAAVRMMDDRRGVPLLADVIASLRGRSTPAGSSASGCFIALEGGEGAGKSTQVQLLVQWLRTRGFDDIVVTREPGATPVGRTLRATLLAPETGQLSPRTEALLYAADRAEHVATVIEPALERGAVVVCDRYLDSSLAYQGGGRELSGDEVARLNVAATKGLVPDLTVVLDVDPAVGLRRAGDAPDRIEAEPLEFHARVRQAFLQLAARAPQRYLVVDASVSPEQVQEQIRNRLAAILPAAAGVRREVQVP